MTSLPPADPDRNPAPPRELQPQRQRPKDAAANGHDDDAYPEVATGPIESVFPYGVNGFANGVDDWAEIEEGKTSARRRRVEGEPCESGR